MTRLLAVGALAILAVVLELAPGCYGPHYAAGSPCSSTQPCPGPLVCDVATMTCELSGQGIDAGHIDGPKVYHDAPAMMADAAHVEPTNDNPNNPMMITSTTVIMEDVTLAMSDASGDGTAECGTGSSRTVFFYIQTTHDETWYFDTFPSNYNTIIREYAGSCVGGVQPNNTSCAANDCGTGKSQLVAAIPGGSAGACIEVSENINTGVGPTASLTLDVERIGHANVQPLPLNVATPYNGNTCTAGTAGTMGTCGGSGAEDVYYFTLCPGDNKMLSATTCNPSTQAGYGIAMYARSGVMGQLACEAENVSMCMFDAVAASLSGVPVSGAHLFSLVVDSVVGGSGGGSCGPYGLTATLQ